MPAKRLDLQSLRAELNEAVATKEALLEVCLEKGIDIFAAGEQLTDEGKALKADYDENEASISRIKAAITRKEEIDEMRRSMAPPDRRPDESGSVGSNATTTVAAQVKEKPKNPWNSFGDFLGAVRLAGNGGAVDQRFAIQAAASGMSETVSGDGGFLVHSDFSTEIFRRMYETSAVASRCREVRISSSSNSISLPYFNESSRANGSRLGGVRAYWKGEGDTVTATKPTFGTIDIKLSSLMALGYITSELLDDHAAVESILFDAFAEECEFTLEDAIINGNGAAKPIGILNANCLVTVAKETGQSATTILSENVMKMWSRLWPKSWAKSAWFVNVDTIPELMKLQLTVGTGGLPLFMPPNGLADSPFATLMGRPVVPIEYCATLGTVGDIILGDFSQYILARKGTLKTDSSMHVRFVNDETAFRVTIRVNGQPSWQSALTPFKGSATQSPFVALATRS